MLKKFHYTLSERTVELRYFHLMKLSQRVAHERLTKVCFNDYDREIALVAERCNPATGEPSIIAVGRLSREPRGGEAEFAVLVSDEWQQLGLGTDLTIRCVEIAKAEGIGSIIATVLPGNREMLVIFKRLGFEISMHARDGMMTARKDLSKPD